MENARRIPKPLYGVFVVRSSVIVLLAATQVAPTVPSRFLVHEGVAYVASPVRPVMPVTEEDRFCWSPDGSRLAVVSGAPTDSQGAQLRRLTKGEAPSDRMRLSVWSRDTGRLSEVFSTQAPAYIGAVGYVGADLVFASGVEASNANRLWLARNGGGVQPLALPGFTGRRIQTIASPLGDGLVVAGEEGLWLVNAKGVHSIEEPNLASMMVSGIAPDGRAILNVRRDSVYPAYLLVDFSTGATTQVEETTQAPTFGRSCPFVLDGYGLWPRKAPALYADPDSAEVDENVQPTSHFVGGGQLDLVERKGDRRRRLPFLHGVASSVKVAPDGLSFAFVSNGVLMVRSLVRCDAATTKRLIAAERT